MVDAEQPESFQRNYGGRTRRVFQQRHFADNLSGSTITQHGRRVEVALDHCNLSGENNIHRIARLSFEEDDIAGNMTALLEQ
ncbi:MAG: hypothetical protein BWY63_02003 [Chloroflexi bacterium ADurb.Bin360]|nr:MAG: hypothetical protein BWY63_02003 [Chloroflexi bacterium ADurb.Bin360]